jgi:transcriptional regulator with XRE-family HTH domain
MSTSLSESSGHARPSHTGPPGHHPGLGERLRRARNDRGLTLEQIANETRIPQRNLEALEHDNFAVVPAGFYRRAQVRAYARAVNLDQGLASTELDRVEAVPETPKKQTPIFSRQRVWIVIGVVVAAPVFWRAMVGREPPLDAGGHAGSVIDSPQHEVLPVRETPPTIAVETHRAAPASTGDFAATTGQAEVRVSADSITELIVTTQPPGARVTVNGIGWGLAPVTIRYLPAGDKRIRVSKEGYVTEERTVSLAEGRPRMLDITLSSVP